jgi:site-specific DNA-methyltransferase (adenine-specific)
MAAMEAESVDSIVTDPPYGLEFMGKEWDAFKTAGVRYRTDKAPGRVGDEGKYLAPVSYGGTERRRSKVCTGCGKRDKFQNSHSCPEGTAWEVVELEAGGPPATMLTFQAWCEAWGREALRVTKPGGYLLAFGGTRTHHRLVCGLEDAGWIIRDELDWIYASGFPKGKANLKPAHEPIVLARKPGPLRPLAIDECRIGAGNERPLIDPVHDRRPEPGAFQEGSRSDGTTTAGRWPSNVLLSDPALFDEKNAEVVGSGATASSGMMLAEHQRHTVGGNGLTHGAMEGQTSDTYGDSGGYSRFFIVPKADRADREPVLRGQLEKSGTGLHDDDNYRQPGERKANHTAPMPRENAHPTVKPVDLMRHLVRLVTPQGGTVLDCFLGSGSTALAAELEGFQWIGIEKEAEYVKIAEARLNGTQKGLGLHA